ncbi:DUF2165 domain-containing protein [Streptomyces sp. HNM0574]|uniref:DUF2165 domain-containing protein n=1 Tax=Streptomyces sp. HNM0574 TaxID=2714954 RepID=UPI00146CA565|nr:DUF2165 domain-containing protein [Streptomyces sp. HNM0574]NLU66753.1 DUF2165 domain-containing protein [Streptomyces sp. HNM0574]
MTVTFWSRREEGARGRVVPSRLAAGLLTGMVAVHMVLIVFGNVTDFGTNREFVRHVLSMDTTFKDPDLMWRAVASRPLQDAAYLLIIAWEALTAILLTLACLTWVRALRPGPRAREALPRAHRLSSLGLLAVMLLFGGGFLTLGGEWFAMWQSEDWNGLDSALRNFLVAGVGWGVVQVSVRDEGSTHRNQAGEGEV